MSFYNSYIQAHSAGQDEIDTEFSVTLYFLFFIVLIEVREDLILGACTIWGTLGAGNMIATGICIGYMIRSVSWGKAAKKSSIAMQRIESLSVSLNSDKEARKGSVFI